MAVKWRKIRNILTINQSIGSRIIQYKSGPKKLYQFKCLQCGKLMETQLKHIPYLTGLCKKHSQMIKPFEAAFGAMKRSSKTRKLKFDLTYEEYIEFTKNPNCYYCNDKLDWRPYNEHGKNGPGWKLDRLNSKYGYIKDNCVQCCPRCNLAKRSLSDSEFIEMCIKISHNIERVRKILISS